MTSTYLISVKRKRGRKRPERKKEGQKRRKASTATRKGQPPAALTATKKGVTKTQGEKKNANALSAPEEAAMSRVAK